MKSVRKILFFALACCLIFAAGAISSQAQTTAGDKFIVVIDPGHGGNQPGATYGGIQEKDINLAIALKFGKLIAQNMPNVSVLYTRTNDKSVPLAARGDMANKAHADLFVSIHINAHDNSSAAGTSTWVMGVEKTAANLAEAMRENEVIRYEKGSAESYEGFDPSSPESYVMFQLVQSAHFDRSIQFARMIQRNFATGTTMRDRGAEQGPFLVLWKATMPAVLTEVGFLSNPSDRVYISSKRGQDDIAMSLFTAFREYVNMVGNSRKETSKVTITPVPAPVIAPTPAPVVAPAPAPATVRPAPAPVRRSTPSFSSYYTNNRNNSNRTTTNRPMRSNDYYTASGSGSLRPGYYVQLMALSSPASVDDSRFGPYRGQVKERFVGGLYKYMIGPYSNSQQANWIKGDVRANGFYDAFIVKL